MLVQDNPQKEKVGENCSQRLLSISADLSVYLLQLKEDTASGVMAITTKDYAYSEEVMRKAGKVLAHHADSPATERRKSVHRAVRRVPSSIIALASILQRDWKAPPAALCKCTFPKKSHTHLEGHSLLCALFQFAPFQQEAHSLADMFRKHGQDPIRCCADFCRRWGQLVCQSGKESESSACLTSPAVFACTVSTHPVDMSVGHSPTGEEDTARLAELRRRLAGESSEREGEHGSKEDQRGSPPSYEEALKCQRLCSVERRRRRSSCQCDCHSTQDGDGSEGHAGHLHVSDISQGASAAIGQVSVACSRVLDYKRSTG